MVTAKLPNEVLEQIPLVLGKHTVQHWEQNREGYTGEHRVGIFSMSWAMYVWLEKKYRVWIYIASCVSEGWSEEILVCISV